MTSLFGVLPVPNGAHTTKALALLAFMAASREAPASISASIAFTSE